jgi:ribosomal protein L7Ae-like RNA K-turn-binding protein
VGNEEKSYRSGTRLKRRLIIKVKVGLQLFLKAVEERKLWILVIIVCDFVSGMGSVSK